MTWLHPAMSSERLETIRFWSLRTSEQSREYGEPEESWAPSLDAADRAADLLDQRRECHMSPYSGCTVARLWATEAEREKRNGCFFPICLIPNKRIMHGRVQFHRGR